MKSNVPDDWNNYWTKCNVCGYKWHLSEGNYCEKCYENEQKILENNENKDKYYE